MEELKQEFEEKFLNGIKVEEWTNYFEICSEELQELWMWIEAKVSQVEKPVIWETAEWTKIKPNKPCVFMTRVWNNQLKIYDYNIWRLITTNGESLESPTYLGWYTEGGDEWDDYSTCNFDEYKIIGEV